MEDVSEIVELKYQGNSNRTTNRIEGISVYQETHFDQENLIGAGHIESFRNTLKANFRGVVNSLRNPPMALAVGTGTTIDPDDLLLSARLASQIGGGVSSR